MLKRPRNRSKLVDWYREHTRSKESIWGRLLLKLKLNETENMSFFVFVVNFYDFHLENTYYLILGTD